MKMTQEQKSMYDEINRILDLTSGTAVRKSLNSENLRNYGEFYLIDIQSKKIISQNINLKSYLKEVIQDELECQREYELMVEVRNPQYQN